MAFVKLALPPGVFKNGTKYQSMGRWFDANLVRWTEGAMKPIGGWTRVGDTNGNIDLDERTAGLFAWRDNSGSRYLMVGTPEKLWVLSGGVLTDIIDGSFTAGQSDASADSGAYGQGAYGAGLYGEGSTTAITITEAQSWQFDNFGELPVALAISDGRLLEWDLNTANNVAAVSGAPTSNLGVVVTPERFLVALGAGGDPRKVQWSDQEDRTQWTPASTNQSGDFILATTGEIMCGLRSRNETLIFTSTDLHAMKYIGGTLVYSFSQLGSGCGIVSRQAYAAAEGRVFWMGRKNFFVYDGFVKQIPCPISDEIFPNLNTLQASKVSAVALPNFNEIWFMYTASGSVENNKIAVYNYVENHWSGPWTLRRTAGVDSSIFGTPYLGGDEGSVFAHETGIEYDEPDGFASGTLTRNGANNLLSGDQISFGGITYTFESTPSAAYDVQHSANEDTAYQNLVAAINASGTAGVEYASGTEQNPHVSAEHTATETVEITARRRGTNGNDIAAVIDIDTNSSMVFTGASVVTGVGSTTLTGGTDTAQTPSAESGPIEIGQGDNVMTVRRIIPDETSLGDVDLTLYAALYPTASEESQSITTLNEPTDARLTGRQVRLKIAQDQPSWRWGNARLEVVPRGRR